MPRPYANPGSGHGRRMGQSPMAIYLRCGRGRMLALRLPICPPSRDMYLLFKLLLMYGLMRVSMELASRKRTVKGEWQYR